MPDRPDQDSPTASHKSRNLVVLAVVVIVIVALGLVYESGLLVLQSSGTSSEATSPLSVGDYADYNGTLAVGLSATYVSTVRIQVAVVNATAVEWIQSSTIQGQPSQKSYWIPSSVPPFHYNMTFLNSTSTPRLIGSKTYQTTADVYFDKSGNETRTYYYAAGSNLLPVEIHETWVAVVAGSLAGFSDDLYLTSTNIPGVIVVTP